MRLLEILGINLPIIPAPMAGVRGGGSPPRCLRRGSWLPLRRTSDTSESGGVRPTPSRPRKAWDGRKN